MTGERALAPMLGTNGGDEKLFAACRGIVAARGFASLSLRAVARASGWTMGEIAYRVGAKDRLVAAYLAHERGRGAARDRSWRDRLAGPGKIGGALLAAIVEAYIDDISINDPGAAIIWQEAMLEAVGGDVPSAPILAWIEDHREHWRAILHERHAHAHTLGKIVADYIIAEQIYTVALSADPAYRLMRSACAARLCGVRVGTGWRGWERLLPAARENRFGREAVPAMGRQARSVADAAARLIREQGASAVTHRSVASVLGRSTSAVSHHFGSRVELMAAAFDSLFQSVRSMLEHRQSNAPLGVAAGDSSAVAIGFVRTLHIIALVAARDAAFLPLMLDERVARGRLIEAWYGQALIGTHRTDRLFLQIVSLVAGVRTLEAALVGDAVPGGNRDALAEMLRALG